MNIGSLLAAANPVAMIGTALAGGGQMIGQHMANQSNERIAGQATAANSYEAKAARDWEEKMSNTSVQRRTDDLKKAGWNPVLATENAASTPSATPATAATATHGNVGAGLLPAISTALDAYSTFKQGELVDSQKVANRASAESSTTAAEVNRITSELKRQDLPSKTLKAKIVNTLTQGIQNNNRKIREGLEGNKKKWEQKYGPARQEPFSPGLLP